MYLWAYSHSLGHELTNPSINTRVRNSMIAYKHETFFSKVMFKTISKTMKEDYYKTLKDGVKRMNVF